MSNKFTGITSAGSAIPVYDKDAHSALGQKLDTSAFSSVSGEFATIDDVVAAVSGKADTSAIPSLDGYATEQWVGEQGYLTEVPESAVSGFATHEEVESATSGKMDLSGLASGSASQQYYPYYRQFYSGYNGIPFYAAYISGDKLDTSAATAVSPNFSQNNNQNIGSAKFSGWLDGVGLDLSSTSGFKRIYITDEGITLSGYSSENDKWHGENAHYLNINHENYVDKTKFKNIVASDNEIFVPNYVKTVSGNYDTVYSNYSFIGDFSGNDNLSREFTVTLPVATTSFTYTAAQQNWGWLYIGTLTSEDPKTVWKFTPDKDYNEINSEVSTATFYTLQITQTPFPYTGGVVSASLVTWNDEVFATRPWVEEQLSANVPTGVMQTSGLEYDGDKISGYMGSAFKAGTELEFEYDSADNISAINSSAISTTPSQALYAKSPLYAGVSGTSSFIGVDETLLAQLIQQESSAVYNETVLWSGSSTGSNYAFNLSGNISDFEYIEMYATDVDGWCGYMKTPTEYFTTANRIPIVTQHFGTQTKNIIMRGMYVHPTSDNTLDSVSFGFDYAGSANPNSNFSMKRIVGIGRKN